MESFEIINLKIRDLVVETLQHITHDDLLEDRDLFAFNLDSINAVRLIFKLQETFDITFDAHEIRFENFASIGKMTEAIARKKASEYAFAA